MKNYKMQARMNGASHALRVKVDRTVVALLLLAEQLREGGSVRFNHLRESWESLAHVAYQIDAVQQLFHEVLKALPADSKNACLEGMLGEISSRARPYSKCAQKTYQDEYDDDLPF